jgi:hypothetical protein
MAMRQLQVIPDTSAQARRPIEYLTENGFSIIRCCDVDPSFLMDGPEHRFIVRDTDGYELEITVDILPGAVAEVVGRSRGRISPASSYWLACAERHLAEYLWEHDDYPADGTLKVEELTLDDIDLTRRWENDKDIQSLDVERR